MTQALTLFRPYDGLRRSSARARVRARALWRAYPREVVGAGLLGLVAAGAIATAAISGSGDRIEAAPPAPPPMIVRPIAPDQAVKLNAEVPVNVGPNPAAAPFEFKGNTAARSQALQCLASAVYYEAGNQDADGERAVAQVVLNRVRHPAFPSSVCGVVYEGSTRVTGCQFTFTCDGSMTRQPMPALWNRARQVAAEMLKGRVYAPVGHATHYHANYVVPYWASSLVKTGVEGVHIFYRWAGGWGRPAAFSSRWSGHEASPAALRLAALSAPHVAPPVKAAEATVQKLEDAGAKVIEGKDGRVRLLFTPQAREAVERVKVTPYVERVAASDNLKFALSGAEDSQRAFGRKDEAGTEPSTAQ